MDKKEKLKELEHELQSNRDDLAYLYEQLESSLREELTSVLAENERMEQRIKFCVETGNQPL
ncbi:MAG: hypothetical protein WC248_05885 [Candidatus Methanomethylophilaceae archaeon]